MEYLGIAGAWDRAQSFAASNPELTTTSVVGALVVVGLILYWVAKG